MLSHFLSLSLSLNLSHFLSLSPTSLLFLWISGLYCKITSDPCGSPNSVLRCFWRWILHGLHCSSIWHGTSVSQSLSQSVSQSESEWVSVFACQRLHDSFFLFSSSLTSHLFSIPLTSFFYLLTFFLSIFYSSLTFFLSFLLPLLILLFSFYLFISFCRSEPA